MHLLEVAYRQYERLSSTIRPIDPSRLRIDNLKQRVSSVARQLSAWLRNYVVPAIEQVRDLPAFTDAVTWSLRNILDQKRSTGWDQRVRKAILAVVRAQVRVAKLPQILAALRRTREDVVIEESVFCTGDNSNSESRRTRSECVARKELAAFERCLEAGLQAFVEPDDVLTPNPQQRQGKHLLTTPLKLVLFNCELVVLGDSAARCLLHSAEHWRSRLQKFRGRLADLAEPLDSKRGNRLREQERSAWDNLTATLEEARSELLTSRGAQARAACLALVQAYLGAMPCAELSFLSIGKQTTSRFRDLFQYLLNSPRASEMTDCIAAALRTAHRYLREFPEVEHDFEQAIQAGGLVLALQSRRVFFEGKSLDIPWRRLPVMWRLMIALAEKVGLPIDPWDVLGRDGEPLTTLCSQISDLKKLLGHRWRKRIVKAGTRQYQLDLDIKRVHLFQNV